MPRHQPQPRRQSCGRETYKCQQSGVEDVCRRLRSTRLRIGLARQQLNPSQRALERRKNGADRDPKVRALTTACICVCAGDQPIFTQHGTHGETWQPRKFGRLRWEQIARMATLVRRRAKSRTRHRIGPWAPKRRILEQAQLTAAAGAA